MIKGGEDLKKNYLKRITSMALVSTMILSSGVGGMRSTKVEAAYTAGNAPYINTWLVSGPSDTSITDGIYGETAGFSEVNVFDGDPIGGEENPDAVKLGISSVSASTTLAGSNAGNAIDGNMDTAWKSDTRQGVVWDSKLTLTVNLTDVAEITKIKINGFERDNKQLKVQYSLISEDGSVVKTLVAQNIVGADFTTSDFTGAYNVKKIEAKIVEMGGAPNHLGIKEIEVYGVPGKVEAPEPPEPTITIVPRLGEQFGEGKWEYFDDRIFNRNTDDYQDMYGYYKVKQGLETEGKYVYAHTYVYSPKAQSVQLRMVTSGLHKAYVNDILVHQAESAVESSNKDHYKQGIKLKEGWNKVLLEIKHTRVHYLGFYARLCNDSGDKVDGLIYSVMGNQEPELKILTQGLDINREEFEARNVDIPSNVYPDNELPYGYTEWPYVWNKPIHRTNNFAPQGSQFQFQVAGGTPGYTWEISEGKLPDGLTMDNTGAIDGFCQKAGEYPFTLKVTDSKGVTATKETRIIVKERPNKWFEEGKMSALSHDTGAYTQFFDENFSFDLWAERAKKAGMTLLSTEAVQGVYYWPAPGSFPGDPSGAAAKQHPYTTEVVHGKRQPKDMVKLAKEAAERHGLRFGVYYASEGSNQFVDGRVNNSSGFFENVEDLVKRYDPSYLFFDGGPQSKGNIDAMWSAVRAYNDHALIQANDQNEVSDNDLTILETEYTGKMPYVHGGYWETNMWNQNKYTVDEAWSHPVFKEIDAWSGYAGGNMRDDWRLWTEFIIYSIGHGIVPNYDQMIINTRGVDWNGGNFSSRIKNVYYNTPLNAQLMIDLRDKVNAWMANEGNPDLHESLFGTMPYYFDTYVKKAGWHENTEKEPFLTAKYGEGPDWGYAVARDQYVYMHMQENTMGSGRAKKGFTGQTSIEAGPFYYDVEKVEWLNVGTEIPFTPYEKDGKNYITIDTSSVIADPIDTILKITTTNPTRDFKLTSVKLFSEQTVATELQLRAEAYLKTFTSVFADAELTYTSSNPAVATVDQSGLVKPVGTGIATIKVTAAYEGESATDEYKVEVKADGSISAGEELISVVMRTDGKEAYGRFSTDRDLQITFEGRTQKGGGVNILKYDDIAYHYAVCSGQKDGQPATPDDYWHDREVDTLDILDIVDDNVVFKGIVPEEQNVAIWAEVTIDGKTYTTNKNFLRIDRESVLNKGALPEVSSNSDSAKDVTDGVINSADGGNTSKWTPASDDTNPTMTFKLDSEYTVENVRVFFNNKDRLYMNVPKGIKIEVSSDNLEWKTVVAEGAVPTTTTKYFYEDELKYAYAMNERTQYVRISFPGGAQGAQMDILEVEIRGYDASNVLSKIEVDTKPSEDNTQISLEVKGYTGLGEELNMTGAKITVTSSNEAVAKIEDNKITALSEGVSLITVTADLDGFKASQTFYVKVDSTKKISLMDYLKSINVELDNNMIDKDENNIINVKASGKLNTGEDADLSKAIISCEFKKDSNLQFNAEDRTITAKGELTKNAMDTAKFTISLDGVTLVSQSFDLRLVANYFAVPGKIEAEDGIIVGKEVRTQTADGGTILGYIREGDEYTYFVNAEQEDTFEVYYRAVAYYMDEGIEFHVNGELQGRIRFEETGTWDKYSTVKQPGYITLQEGINVITLKPKGGNYVCNLNWFELKQVELSDVSSVTVTPSVAEVQKGTTLEFHAVVEGENNPEQTVTWEVTGGVAGTTINENGLLTVSADETAKTLTVTATSTLDKSVSGTATVTVTETEVSIPPVTTDDVPIGWVNQDTIVTLNAVAGSAEVADTYYIVDDGEQQTGTSVVLSEEGVHTIVYWSVDKEGNVEQAHTVTVSIDKTAPEIQVVVPGEGSIYEDSGDLTLQYTLADVLSGVDSSKTTVTLDGNPYELDNATPLYTLPLGQHTLIVSTTDLAGNQGSKTVNFQTVASVDSLKALVTLFANNNWIDNHGIANSLQAKLKNNNLNSFVNEVKAQSGKHISREAAEYLLRDAEYIRAQK